MQLKKYSLALALTAGILCVPAVSKLELPEPKYEDLLIGNPYPTLTGVDQLYVEVVRTYTIPEITGLNERELRLRMEQKLTNEGIECAQAKPSPLPCLRVGISLLKIPDSQEYVFHIQTSLSRLVTLGTQQRLNIRADVWKVNPVMQIASIESMPAKVTEVALEQVEAFVRACQTANSKGKQPPDSNEISIVPKEEVRSVVKQEPTKYEYVASKNSNVFHKPDCRWAKNISPKNLVGYGSRDEAIAAGKKPCKSCKP